MNEIQVDEIIPEKVGKVRNGITVIIVWLLNLPVMIVLWALSGVSYGGSILPGILCSLFFLIAPMCLYMLQPNQAAVLTLFGAYRGSDETE